MYTFLKRLLKTLLYVVLAVVLIWIFLWAKHQITKPKGANIVEKGTVSVIIDETEEAFRSRLAEVVGTEKHPAGVTWYTIDFNHSNLENRKQTHIILQTSDSSIQFDYPIDIMISLGREPRKANDISLSLGLSEKKAITHQEAISNMYAILKNITDAGWKRYIGESTVRLCGKEALRVQDDRVKILMTPMLDEQYRLNLEEWLSQVTVDWEFYYKNEAVMNLSLFREKNELDALSGYFLTIGIKTVEAIEKTNYKGGGDWKAGYRAKIPKYKASRAKYEKIAIERGYSICTDYVDAPFHQGIFKDDDVGIIPTEDIVIRSGELCPKEGQWQAFLPVGHPKEDIVKYSGMHTIWCAKDIHINSFGLSGGYENDIRWRWISDENKTYDPNQ